MSKILKAFVISCIILTCSGSIMAAGKYSSEFLMRQFKFYSSQKAQEFIKQGDYTKAAINALSIYPISSKEAIYIALLLEKEVKEPLPGFLFKAYQKMGIASDPSVKLEKDGESIFVEEWINQKAKWSDNFINEIRCYIRIRELLSNDQEVINKFFFGAFDTYYYLDSKEAFTFLGKFDNNSIQFKILTFYSMASNSGEPANIEELEKIDIKKCSKAMKEMLVTLKGDYYITQKDFKKAKESYLEFFELDYSLPVHIENLAMCHIATEQRDKAKELLLYLTRLFQAENISNTGIYNLACIFALENNKEKALKYLAGAIRQGFPKSHVRNDEDFKSLREDKRFIELVK